MIKYLTVTEFKKQLKQNPDTILDVLFDLDEPFFLCGSRRMAQRQVEEKTLEDHLNLKERSILISSDTDFDFYATHSKDLEAYLVSKGMTSATLDDYLDDEAVAVLSKDNVQVVLRKNAIFYHDVFENISTEFFFRYIWKSSPDFRLVSTFDIREIMNQLFKTARERNIRTYAIHHAG